MILNTIIEEEKNPYDAFALALFERFEKDYAELCATAVKQGFPKPKNQNTTAMQRAYEAGEKKGREGCQISDFKCSEHGVITPKPMCPKCSKT